MVKIRTELFGMSVPEAESYLKYCLTGGAGGGPISQDAVDEAEALLKVLKSTHRPETPLDPDSLLARVAAEVDRQEAAVESYYKDGKAALADALLVAKSKSGAEPAFEPRRYDDAMLVVSERARRPTESREAAFARLVREGDVEVTALWLASQQAAAIMAKRAESVKRASVGDRVSKRDEVLARLDGYVRSCVREGRESREQCSSRLARDGDPTYASLVFESRRAAGE